jgi:endonuclease/exonuclease/phosphatase family metal-dependent hydrolase
MFRFLPTIVNYEEPELPIFTGAYGATTAVSLSPSSPTTLKIISYNINFGHTYAEATQEIQTIPALQNPDILLLQEMDEIGCEMMAQTLAMNYVYYPASIHNQHGRNFGNAILSRWPLANPHKLILPYKSWYNQQIRIAVRAEITLGRNLTLLVYAVHTEVYTAPRHYRQEQVQAVVDDIQAQNSALPIIVGGDFNTATRRGIVRMEQQFATAGLTRASKGAGSTVAKFGPTAIAADHLFSRGLRIVARGAVSEAQASDHYPVWLEATLPLNPLP